MRLAACALACAAALEDCPRELRAARFVLSLIVTTRDLPPARPAEPVYARLGLLHRAAFGANASWPSLVLVDGYPDKTAAATRAWADTYGATLRAHDAAAASVVGAPARFEHVDAYGAFGRAVFAAAFGAPPCGAGAAATACSRFGARPAVAAAEAGCDGASRCVRAENLRTTLPYLWSALRLRRCGVGYVVHQDADVVVAAPARGGDWAVRAAALLDGSPEIFAVHVADHRYPFGRPCAVDDAACEKCADGRPCRRPWCDDREDRRRSWRGRRVAGGVCASILDARRPRRVVDALPPGASLAGGHLSLEAFVMAPARFVERLPLAVANDALELALELTPTMADGAVAVPNDYLGVAGKREGLFVHGRAYYEVT